MRNPYADRIARGLASLAIDYASGSRSVWQNAKYNKGTDEAPEDVVMIPLEIHHAICRGGPGAIVLHDDIDDVAICGVCHMAINMGDQ